MAILKKRVDFFNSTIGSEVKEQLVSMSTDTTYNTHSGYSANTVLYPDNLMTFVEKHMAYLNTHPNIDTDQYMANLRLMTRVR
jgi:hypothetical protein